MKRVVVIDDSEIVLELVKEALESMGLEVVTLSDPSLFGDIRHSAPDLVLLDVNMPEVFGDDVAPYFKDAWNVGAPIYFFSDIDEHDLRRRAQEAGVDGYICKGWGLQRLLERVEEILGLS